ncbi:MAG: hypothetical protein AUJ57_00405 [Zetaproteobacteria bacterium CG1_02_53_45]|nr:MAG: hypothetical protein AUJ57_00405 [Zetaproteobacteria bacterium CG1_02_53_45]
MKKYLITGMIICMGAWMSQSVVIAADSVDEPAIEEIAPDDTGVDNTLYPDEAAQEQNDESPVEETVNY